MLQPEHIPHPIVGDVVRFTLAYNPGAAFSMSLGAYSRYIFGAFARRRAGHSLCAVSHERAERPRACSRSGSRGAAPRAI
jgi:hypothetical protein